MKVPQQEQAEAGLMSTSASFFSRRACSVLAVWLVVGSIAFWAIAAILEYVSSLAEWFFVLLAISLAVALLSVILMLFRLRWRDAICCALPLALAVLSHLYGTGPARLLQVAGFLIHAAPMESYLSRCRLIAFQEGDQQQQLGRCESISKWGDFNVTIIYDTTGEFLMPIQRRTRQWNSAIRDLPAGNFLTKPQGSSRHIYGNFYSVVLRAQDEDGS
jgi:hypothetical protein